MSREKITLEHLKPKFMDSETRYNNWYHTADFIFEETEYCLKLSITEGTLLGQQNFFSLSWDPVEIIKENGISVLKKPKNDINFVNTSQS